jgi:hypothetical protein
VGNTLNEKIIKGDTAKIEAEVYQEDGVTPEAPSSATLSYRLPDGTTTSIGPQAIASGNVVTFEIQPPGTTQIGNYSGKVAFTLPTGDIKSSLVSWEIYDPLTLGTTDVEKTVDLCWMLLEDCFDSDIGGPYLRDATLAYFDKEKMEKLLPLAFMQINLKPPQQQFDETNFPYATGEALLAKALLIETIKHLMRSYVEQPAILGGNVSYFDKRDYLQRWQSIYTIEMEEFRHWLALWKRGFYQFGRSSLLIDLKSGRRQIYPPSARTRGRWW